MDITFVRTRYFYNSYVDMWTMAHFTGFDTCFVDEIDVSKEVVYIIPTINGELLREDDGVFSGHLPNQKEKHKDKQAIIINWNLERQSCSGLRNLEPWIDCMWTSCRYYESVINHPKCMWVPMGSDDCLNQFYISNMQDLYEQKVNTIEWERAPEEEYEKIYDFIHLSYLTHRRSYIIDRLEGSQPPEGHSLWGLDRHKALKKSKFMVNIHQDELLYQEPLRIALAAAYDLPYLSEHTPDSHPITRMGDYLNIEYNNLVKDINNWIKSYDTLHETFNTIGKNLYWKLCRDFPFYKNVTNGVDQLLEERKQGNYIADWNQ